MKIYRIFLWENGNNINILFYRTALQTTRKAGNVAFISLVAIYKSNLFSVLKILYIKKYHKIFNIL